MKTTKQIKIFHRILRPEESKEKLAISILAWLRKDKYRNQDVPVSFYYSKNNSGLIAYCAYTLDPEMQEALCLEQFLTGMKTGLSVVE